MLADNPNGIERSEAALGLSEFEEDCEVSVGEDKDSEVVEAMLSLLEAVDDDSLVAIAALRVVEELDEKPLPMLPIEPKVEVALSSDVEVVSLPRSVLEPELEPEPEPEPELEPEPEPEPEPAPVSSGQ